MTGRLGRLQSFSHPAVTFFHTLFYFLPSRTEVRCNYKDLDVRFSPPPFHFKIIKPKCTITKPHQPSHLQTISTLLAIVHYRLSTRLGKLSTPPHSVEVIKQQKLPYQHSTRKESRADCHPPGTKRSYLQIRRDPRLRRLPFWIPATTTTTITTNHTTQPPLSLVTPILPGLALAAPQQKKRYRQGE